MKTHKKIIILFLFILIFIFPCMADIYGNVHIFFGSDYYSDRYNSNIFNTSSYGLGFGLIFDEGEGGFLRAGLLFEYNMSNILRIRPYMHLGYALGSWIFGAFGFIGISNVFLTDFNTSSIGISPEFGLGFYFLGLTVEVKIQYDFYFNNNFNAFILSSIISIPLFF